MASLLGRTLVTAAAVTLLGGAAFAQDQNPAARMGLKLSGDQPIQIESDKLEVNEKDAKATFSGNVVVAQGTTMMKAGKMTVFYIKPDEKKDENQGKGKAAPAAMSQGSANIDRLEVTDKVYLKSDTQEATGDKGTFDMKTEVMTLSGKQVVLTDGPNILTGCKLTVLMKTGEATVEGCGAGGRVKGGRVKGLLTPGSQPNADAQPKSQ